MLRLLIVFLTLSSLVLGKESGTITDISRYSELLKKVNLDSPGGIFPTAIPKEASEVSFNFFPGTGQRGGHIVLKFKGNAKSIEKKISQTVALKNVHLKNHLNLPALNFIPKDYALYLVRFIGTSDNSQRLSVSGFAVKDSTIIIFHLN
jgi:hypothetical protein